MTKMVDLRNQRRMAADILKCGVNRVKIESNRIEDVAEAVTKTDVRGLIKEGAIKARQKRGISRARTRHVQEQKRKGKRKGHGSRKGTKYARLNKKQRWIQTIRPMRRILREYRNQGRITPSTYRKFYLHAKGGMFKSKAHLNSQLESQNVFIKSADEVEQKPVKEVVEKKGKKIEQKKSKKTKKLDVKSKKPTKKAKKGTKKAKKESVKGKKK
jgi:large subunit ribosomal protein L19e